MAVITFGGRVEEKPKTKTRHRRVRGTRRNGVAMVEGTRRRFHVATVFAVGTAAASVTVTVASVVINAPEAVTAGSWAAVVTAGAGIALATLEGMCERHLKVIKEAIRGRAGELETDPRETTVLAADDLGGGEHPQESFLRVDTREIKELGVPSAYPLLSADDTRGHGVDEPTVAVARVRVRKRTQHSARDRFEVVRSQNGPSTPRVSRRATSGATALTYKRSSDIRGHVYRR